MDARIRAQLVRQMDAYDGSLDMLGHIIADLDAVWNREQDWSENERRRFRSIWGELEQVYAVALDQNARALEPSDETDVRDALRQLRTMLPTARTEGSNG